MPTGRDGFGRSPWAGVDGGPTGSGLHGGRPTTAKEEKGQAQEKAVLQATVEAGLQGTVAAVDKAKEKKGSTAANEEAEL